MGAVGLGGFSKIIVGETLVNETVFIRRVKQNPFVKSFRARAAFEDVDK